jgi:hypothetical protein
VREQEEYDRSVQQFHQHNYHNAVTPQSMPRIFLEKPTTVIDLMPGVVGWGHRQGRPAHQGDYAGEEEEEEGE